MSANTCRRKECNCPDCRLARIEAAVEVIAGMLAELRKGDGARRRSR